MAAGKTLPMYTPSTDSLGHLALFKASVMARAPNLGAGIELSELQSKSVKIRQ